MSDIETIKMFLNCPLNSPNEVFEKFLAIENAQYYEYQGYPVCVYVAGKRKDKVLLVAHADTVWDGQHSNNSHIVLLDDGDIYRSLDIYRDFKDNFGIGADDRAGCAILWLLKDLGHSLLITNGEELGNIGSKIIKCYYQELFEELNSHQYMLEFDRSHSHEYKVYDIPVTEEFKKFIEANTGYKEADKYSHTDITVLCDKICGANLSVGYYDEHTELEYLNFREWKHTLDVARRMLEPQQSKYLLRRERG